MTRIFNFVLGLLIGGIIGAAIVLLLTPQSGQDVQNVFKEKLNYLAEEGRKASEAKKAELETRMANIRAGKGS